MVKDNGVAEATGVSETKGVSGAEGATGVEGSEKRAARESAAEIGARIDGERIMIFLPPTGIKDEDTVAVFVNGIPTFIPKGKRVAVTRPVYEVLMRSEDAHMQTLRFDREKENVDLTREKW